MRHRFSVALLRLQGSTCARSGPSVHPPVHRHRGTSGGPAGRSSNLGAEGHGFFSRRFASALHRVCGHAGPKPCSSPGPGPICTIMVSLRPGSIVTVLVSESVWGRCDRIFWFRSNPSPAAREPSCPSPQPFGPLVRRSPRVCRSTWRQAVRAPGRCGFRGSSSVCGPCFRACAKPGTGPFCVVRATRHSTPCPGPVGRLRETPSEFLIRGITGTDGVMKACEEPHLETAPADRLTDGMITAPADSGDISSSRQTDGVMKMHVSI